MVKHPSNSATDMPSKGKKKNLLSPFYERVLDILFKCLDILDCLEYFVKKAAVNEGDREFEVIVGYGFMLSYFLSLKGVPLGKG